MLGCSPLKRQAVPVGLLLLLKCVSLETSEPGVEGLGTEAWPGTLAYCPATLPPGVQTEEDMQQGQAPAACITLDWWQHRGM